MKKPELKILEKAYSCEIEAALRPNTLPVMQTKSKLAEKLVADGLLQTAEFRFGGQFPVIVRGYLLTELGRMTYCMSCA